MHVFLPLPQQQQSQGGLQAAALGEDGGAPTGFANFNLKELAAQERQGLRFETFTQDEKFREKIILLRLYVLAKLQYNPFKSRPMPHHSKRRKMS